MNLDLEGRRASLPDDWEPALQSSSEADLLLINEGAAEGQLVITFQAEGHPEAGALEATINFSGTHDAQTFFSRANQGQLPRQWLSPDGSPRYVVIYGPTTYLQVRRNQGARQHYRVIDRRFVIREEQLTPTDSRNKFAFEEWQRGRTLKEIWLDEKKHPDWEQVSSPEAVRRHFEAWAKLKDLTTRSGKPGRPPRKSKGTR